MTDTFTVPTTNAEQVTAFLELIMRDGGVHEVSLFGPLPGRLPLTLFTDDVPDAAHFALLHAPAAYRTAYVRMNPVDRQVTDAAGAIRKAADGLPHSSAITEQVTRLRFLQVDIDAPTDGEHKASRDEHHATALRKRDRLASFLLTQYGMEPVYSGDTGNGGNLLYAIDLPNDPEHRRILKACIATINRELEPEGIGIDPAVVDAPRYVGIAGTVNAKEEKPSEVYPWRLRAGTVHADAPTVPVDVLMDLAAPSLIARTKAVKSGPRREITLDRHEVQEIIRAIKPHWGDGVRHNSGQGVAGLLWHRGISYEQARTIIIELSQEDNDQEDRLASLDRAYDRGTAGETVAYFAILSEVMTEAGLRSVASVFRTIERARGPVRTFGGKLTADASHTGTQEESADVPPADQSKEPADEPAPPFRDEQFAVVSNAHHVWVPPKVTKDGDEIPGYWKPIANFAAWSEADALYPEDDSLNYSEVVLTNRHGKRIGPKRVKAADFRRPDEYVGMWGSWPRIYPGVSRALILNATQVAGGDVPVVEVYDRTGWRISGDAWQFLSASGAMGADRLDESIRVEPGGRLEEIVLQPVGDIEPARVAVREILNMRHVAETDAGHMAVMSTLAAAFRAPLIPAKRANTTLTLMGMTGSAKSGLAGLVSSLYGPTFNYDRLPGTWQSTANANIDLLTRPRHTMLAIDDYLEKETGGASVGRKANDRDALIRAQGNAATRSRLRSDATRNDGKEPAVILVSTQETLGSYLDESEIGRQLIIPMVKGCLSIEAVKEASLTFSRTGVYNLGFSAYIQWLAGHMPHIVQEAESIHAEIERVDLAGFPTRSGRPLHERTKPAASDLLLGWHYFLEFALETGAISEEEHERTMTRVTGEIAELMLAQDQFQAGEAPERVFLEILQEAILSKHACLASRANNDAPNNARLMGWTPVARETRDDAWVEFRAAPHRIGWVDDEHVYLSASATAKALQGIAASARKNVPLGERQLGAHLSRHGISLPGHGGRYSQTIKIGETTEGNGTTARALVIPRHVVFPEIPPDQPSDPIDISQKRKGEAA